MKQVRCPFCGKKVRPRSIGFDNKSNLPVLTCDCTDEITFLLNAPRKLWIVVGLGLTVSGILLLAISFALLTNMEKVKTLRGVLQSEPTHVEARVDSNVAPKPDDAKLHAEESALKASIDKLKLDRRNIRHEIARAEEEFELTKKRFESAHKTLRKNQNREKTEVEREIQYLRDSRDNAKEEISRLAHQRKNLAAQCAGIESRVASLKRELEEHEYLQIELQKDISRLKETYARLESRQYTRQPRRVEVYRSYQQYRRPSRTRDYNPFIELGVKIVQDSLNRSRNRCRSYRCRR